jgi:hypothetical protein
MYPADLVRERSIAIAISVVYLPDQVVQPFRA